MIETIISIIITIVFIIFWDKYRERIRKRDCVKGQRCPYCGNNITHELKTNFYGKLICQTCNADLTSIENKIKRDPPIELYDNPEARK